MPSLYELSAVRKTHGTGAAACRALRSISLQLAAGQSLAIVGESGSGKSTLLSIMGMLDTASGGRVAYKGTDVASLSERQRDRLRSRELGFVFQNAYLDPRMTVAENVALPLIIAGRTRGLNQRVSEALAPLGLADRLRRKAGMLSGGERQRVAIARALINAPEVILADEPTGALDSKTGASVKELLFGMSAERGMSLVIVTHSAALAASCDRAIAIADGTITDGPITEGPIADGTISDGPISRQAPAGGATP